MHQCSEHDNPPLPFLADKSQLLGSGMGCIEGRQASRVSDHLALHSHSGPIEGFLQHHLKSQLQLSPTASSFLIRKRQIIQHMFIRACSRQDQKHFIMLQKAWIQGLFIKFVKAIEGEFFGKECKRDFKEIRANLTEKVLFQLYQLRQFFESSGRLEHVGRMHGEEVRLADIMLLADSALYQVFAQTASKYKIAEEARIIFPRIQTLRNHVNLLTRFPAQISKETTYDNINLLYKDMKHLLRTAVKEFPSFRHDMKELFGGDLAADIKVKERELNGKKGFSSVGFRRILVKWAQTLLQIWPDMVSSIHFLRFMEQKNSMFDGFCFGSSASFSNQMNSLLVNLIYSAQFNSKTKKRNKQFGFYIYDLLRCKVHTKSSFEAFDLLRKIKSQEATDSGKKLQVVRVKNRLDTHNRDILVNFLYGDVLVAEAQIAVVSGFYNESDSRKYQMKHYIYEYERSIFGPTIELILEYEDAHQTDDCAQLFARGRVRPSGRSFPKYFIKHSQVKCPSGHFCLEMTGNMFNNNNHEFGCDCCSNQTNFDGTYFHCYKCSLLFCSSCSTRHQGDFAGLAVSVLNDKIRMLSSEQEVTDTARGCGGLILLLTDENSPASRLYLHFMSYYLMSNRSSYQVKSQVYALSHNESTDSFITSMGIDCFPALLLLNSNLYKIKYMLGVEIFKLPQFLSACDTFLADPSHHFTARCHQGHPLRVVNPPATRNWECSECSTTNHNPPKPGTELLECDMCKYTLCSNCGFLGTYTNPYYQDPHGESYLCTKPTKHPSPIPCPRMPIEHSMEVLFVNPLSTPAYKCGKCNTDYYFNDEQGTPYCKACNCVLCPRCQGVSKPLNPKQAEYVTHEAEVTSNDGINCQECNKPYKKAYSTRTSNPTWKCFICQGTFTKDVRHLSCFRCMKHACTGCLYASRIIRAAFSFEFEGEQQFVCNSGHPIKELTGPQNKHEEQGTFKCSHCQGLFYVDSVRHVCKQCGITSCAQCLLDCFLYDGNILRCNVGHVLTEVSLKNSVSKGFFCRICLDYCTEREVDGSWKCSGCRGYQICKQCSNRMLKRPFEQKPNREKCECGKTLKRLKKDQQSLSVCHYCEGMIKEDVNWSCRFCQIVICIQCVI